MDGENKNTDTLQNANIYPTYFSFSLLKGT